MAIFVVAFAVAVSNELTTSATVNAAAKGRARRAKARLGKQESTVGSYPHPTGHPDRQRPEHTDMYEIAHWLNEENHQRSGLTLRQADSPGRALDVRPMFGHGRGRVTDCAVERGHPCWTAVARATARTRGVGGRTQR